MAFVEPVIHSFPQLPTFDLSNVVARVHSKNTDWTLERLNQAEQDYRQFLANAKHTPGQAHLTNNRDMDEIWHTHILYTRKYEADTKSYFGHFFHHTPAGVKSTEIEHALVKNCCSGGCCTGD